MAIPPFPSQDLAKLVLGYLAEEQLMTAYDEFLQASPYLDAMRNEYDRIFMTSLKSILAEYRAVKIYVETCKPFLLRKKLIQCSNLLEIVRFLVNHIDVNKLSIHEVRDDISSEKNCSSNTLKLSACEVCNSLKLPSCICKTKQNQQKISNSLPVICQDEISLVNSVETTSLADLPGSHIKTRKKLKVLDKGCTLTQSYNSCVSSDNISKQSSEIISSHNKCNSIVPITGTMQKPLQINLECDTSESGSQVTQPKLKTDESNHALGAVCKKHVSDKKQKKLKHSKRKGSTVSSFQDFSSGVIGSENLSGIPLDSNISGNMNVPTCQINRKFDNNTEITKSPLYLRVEAVKTNNNEVIDSVNHNPYIKIRPADEKVKILSDVKVDNIYNTCDKKSIFIKNATSTPLLKMQTIVINGASAYRTQPIPPQQTFTKDEIMAMPTIIVVPSSGSQQMVPKAQPLTSVSTNTTTTQINTIGKSLSPIIIDVTSPIKDVNNSNTNHITEITKNSNDVGLLKTVDAVTHLKNNTSAPKDIATSSTETTTPLVVPRIKKSSSTPRRSSHIRVLDFTTPRRILQETINEQNPDENRHSSLEAILSDNLTTETPTVIDVTDENSIKKQDDCNNDIVCAKKKETTHKHSVPLKDSWDSKLRNMVSLNTEQYYSKARLDNTKNNNTINKNDIGDKVKNKSRKSQKIKNTVIELDTTTESEAETTDAFQIKPKINTKHGIHRDVTSTFYVDKKESVDNNQNKPPAEKEHINTPEAEKVTLQNVIGAKFNITDLLLQTPYKQALYDIQMETPRCLVPDLPDEPVSDIKIMNIPTPRFFDSPKIISATPNYSSCPTDYSSGGSYYKPDDQDFIPSSDLKCVVTPTNEDIKREKAHDNSSNHKRSSRPVRKCAKNVSYYNIVNMKESDNKIEASSLCRESTNVNSNDGKSGKENIKVSREKSTTASRTSSEKKRSSKKRKPPVKREKPQTFMKIKPRRVTPVKESLSSRIKKKTVPSVSPKPQKIRSSSKESNTNETPAVSCVPTKSRRKSSTPRKLDCNKTFTASSSSDTTVVNKIPDTTEGRTSTNTNRDSDVDKLVLLWSDDGSQKVKVLEDTTNNANDSEDISKIKEYIETTTVLNNSKEDLNEENKGVFENDLIKRGFDIETARIIERDLLDTPPHNATNQTVIEQSPKSTGLSNNTLERTLDKVSNNTNETQCDDDDDDDDAIELSIHESNEETNNFIVLEYDDNKEAHTKSPVTLKDKFSMEVCIDDDITVRLRATSFSLLYDFNQNMDETVCNIKETEDAVNSILCMDKLYTPMKESIKSEVYNVFDSTLTSLDTPLKVTSPEKVITNTRINTIVLEEEINANEISEKANVQKRKRLQSDCSDDSVKDNKKSKPDAQYLLSSTNIQNIDIETVLKKLHGP